MVINIRQMDHGRSVSHSVLLLLLLCYFQCYGIIKPMPISSTISFEFLCDISWDNHGFYVTGAAVWYLVFLWVCRHIWFPEAERMAKAEKYVSELELSDFLAVLNFIMHQNTRVFQYSVSVS